MPWATVLSLPKSEQKSYSPNPVQCKCMLKTHIHRARRSSRTETRLIFHPFYWAWRWKFPRKLQMLWASSSTLHNSSLLHCTGQILVVCDERTKPGTFWESPFKAAHRIKLQKGRVISCLPRRDSIHSLWERQEGFFPPPSQWSIWFHWVPQLRR